MWWIRTGKDDYLIQRVLSGHQDDFGILVHRYLPMVQAIARAQGSALAELDDVVQETFLRAYLSLDQLRERAKFPAWLAAIARNCATRLGSQRASLDATAHAWAEAQPEAVRPDLETAEFRAAVRGEIEKLEPAEKEVLYLHYFAGKSSREIARILEVSEPAVRKRLQRAREALGDRLLTQVEFADHARERNVLAQKILVAVLLSSPAWKMAQASALSGAAATGASGALAVAWGAGAVKVVAAVVVVGLAAGSFIFMKTRETGPNTTSVAAPEFAQQPQRPELEAAAPVPEATAESAEPAAALVATTVAVEAIPFEGQVVDGAGAPIPGATAKGACWGDESRERQEALVDEQGRFRLMVPNPCDVYLIWAEKEGFARIKQDQYTLTKSGHTGAMFTLYREGSIEGQLVDARGAGVADRVVTARNHSVESSLWTEPGTTDAQGRFSIKGLVPGDYGLAAVEGIAWNDELELQRLELKEGDHLTDIRLMLEPGLTIEGHVTDTAGKPLKGAFVQAHVGSWNPRNAHADDKGYYLLEKIPEGEASLHVWNDGYQSQGRMVAAGTSDVDFLLDPLGQVSGRVIDAVTKQPIPVFEVCSVEGETATVPGHVERAFKQVEEESGQFTLKKVNPKSTIIARAPGYQPAFQVVNLEADVPQGDVVLALEAGLSLEGRVTDEQGNPVSGAFVLPGAAPVFPTGMDKKIIAQQTAEIASAISADDGSFTLQDLASGIQTFGAWHPDKGVGTASVELSATRTAPLLITLSPGSTVRGVVRVGGEPRAAVPLMATPMGGLGMPYSQATSDAQGVFELTGVPVGKSTITAVLSQPGEPFGGRRLQRDIEVVSGKPAELDLEFSAVTGGILGRVVAPGVEAIAGIVQCMVSCEGGVEQSMGRILDGGFEFKELSPGTATLMVNLSPPAEGGAPPAGFKARARTVRVEVVPGETAEVEVQFNGSASIEGQVLGLKPGEQGRIAIFEGEPAIEEVSLESMAALAPLARGVAAVTPEGSFQLEGLDPGTYTLQAIAASSNGPDFAEKARFATAVITLTEGETATANFDLK